MLTSTGVATPAAPAENADHVANITISLLFLLEIERPVILQLDGLDATKLVTQKVLEPDEQPVQVVWLHFQGALVE